MKLVLELVAVVLIANVDSQFMSPPMGGMQFPPLPPQMPMHMQGMPMPGMPMPGMPMSMSMPISFMGQPKLPTVVMPYHNKHQDKLQNKKKERQEKKTKRAKKDKRRKRKKKKYINMSSDSSSSSSSSDNSDESDDGGYRRANANARRSGRAGAGGARARGGHKQRSQVLTPVISYVTKDGYVVYQKKIKKEKAKDWLEMSNSSPNRQEAGAYRPPSSSEEMLRTILRKQMDKVRSQAKLDKTTDN